MARTIKAPKTAANPKLSSCAVRTISWEGQGCTFWAEDGVHADSATATVKFRECAMLRNVLSKLFHVEEWCLQHVVASRLELGIVCRTKCRDQKTGKACWGLAHLGVDCQASSQTWPPAKSLFSAEQPTKECKRIQEATMFRAVPKQCQEAD